MENIKITCSRHNIEMVKVRERPYSFRHGRFIKRCTKCVEEAKAKLDLLKQSKLKPKQLFENLI